MFEQEILELAQEIVTLAKSVENFIDPNGIIEKKVMACHLAPIMTDILQLKCSALTKAECMKLYLKVEELEMKSTDNEWLTGLEVGHQPDTNEKALNYFKNGGAEDFAIKHRWLKEAYQA